MFANISHILDPYSNDDKIESKKLYGMCESKRTQILFNASLSLTDAFDVEVFWD